MRRPAAPPAGTLDQVAIALTEIAALADTELNWSDHSCDVSFSRIAAEAHATLRRLGYEPLSSAAPSRR